MKTIEERAKEFADNFVVGDSAIIVDILHKVAEESYIQGATEQKAIDHSEEHLNWIIKQHYLWSYEMCHCDNNECCTFKEWIDKAMEG